ncbi:hemolysin family protein [Thiobaca trueperi]|uniref:CBS domain containing-hemolysin-like protein n=1 Tax=Thiobaca trueperi TaxID=127458 RepID=A0A4R3MUN3_9GAMM|nr:hemolysin family protein [Thiobaca trueperi]TCT20190.1 CBS domain containing-hemolysin-like protein [Thiobaca trueperi]
MSLWPFVVVLVLILINALYVAAEFAIVGARVTRVEQAANQGHPLAAALLPILRDPTQLDRHIAACQIGITLSSLILGAFGQATFALDLGRILVSHGGLEPLGAHALSAIVILVVLSSTQVVFGELIPKTVALQYPVGTAIHTYLPLRWSLALYAPLISLLNGSGNLVLRRLGASPEASHRHVHAPAEIDLLIRESCAGGLLESKDSNRLREALRLGRHTVRQLMVPRRQIASLDLNAPLEQLLTEIDASPYTRLLVHQGGLDNVRGFLHVKDVAAAIARGADPQALPSLVRPLLALPSRLTTDRALGQLRDHRARIALVVSEFGDVQGLISLEDIIRELLGELSDEFKSGSDQLPLLLPDGRWRLSGRLPLDEAIEWAQTLGKPAWEPSRAETLAGWILEQLDAVPEAGCQFGAAGLDFEIEQMDGTAINTVLVRLPDGATGDADA